MGGYTLSRAPEFFIAILKAKELVKNKIKNRYTEATHFRDQNMIVIDIW
jgi:hypothetical protein